MAKIGNEAKLILKLAAERMTHLQRQRTNLPEAMAEWRKGYERACEDWEKQLFLVVDELER